jgi:hypothetical protein
LAAQSKAQRMKIPSCCSADLEMNSCPAFTRLELFLAAGAMSLIALLALPTLAGNRTRSERLVCVNNLRQIGIALQVWGDSHDDEKPWRVTPLNGGTSGHALAANAWFHFVVASNELGSPKVLVCPSDAGTRTAIAWTSQQGGFLNPQYRANALSYFVAGHADFAHPSTWVSGDGNLSGFTYGQGCGLLGVSTAAAAITPRVSPTTQWTSTIHNAEGNLLLNSGQVLQVPNSGLMTSVSNSLWLTSDHLLLPR